ncbi:MAG TPA: hypothetical protein VGV87_15095 [Blastocatellia bacterium]|nr:hypothetical protein [Blastocatellia bacterium]
MRKKSIALTLLLGIGLGLTSLANMVGRPSATAATLYAPSQATPTLSINDVSITEGNTGTSNMVFTVTLTASGARPTIGVAYDTANGPPPSGATGNPDIMLNPSGIQYHRHRWASARIARPGRRSDRQADRNDDDADWTALVLRIRHETTRKSPRAALKR